MCMAIVFCVVTLLTLLQLSSKGFRKTNKAIYFYLEMVTQGELDRPHLGSVGASGWM